LHALNTNRTLSVLMAAILFSMPAMPFSQTDNYSTSA
jgi:hypothetical protein